MKEIIADRSIMDALHGIGKDDEVRLCLEGRAYEEKVFAEVGRLFIEGACDGTSVIVWRDAAKTILDDGYKRGTFRSYTAFFSGSFLSLRNVTIRNDAGDGRIAGQCVAAYMDSDVVVAKNCTFVSAQDTLFMSPLPEQEREPGGFRGPRQDSPRKKTLQYYKNCRIFGDIDFIFGGADAVFEDCEIVCLDREHAPGFEADAGGDFVNSYVCAPCGDKDGLGLVFLRCTIRGQAGIRPESVFLGRPWRPAGRAAFLDCVVDECVSPKGFSGWADTDAEEWEAGFAEYGTRMADGGRVDLAGRQPWVARLTQEEATDLKERAERLVKRLLSEMDGE